MEDQNTSKGSSLSPSVKNGHWWLETSTFVITKTLYSYLKDNQVSESDAKELCFVQNEVIKLCDRSETDERGYIRIHRQVWIDKCGGSNYTKRLSLLESIGELEIDNSYCFLSALSTPDQIRTHIPKCKGFKVPSDRLNKGLVNIDFKKKRVIPLKPQSYFNNTECLSSSSREEEEEERGICEGLNFSTEVLPSDNGRMEEHELKLMNYMLECLKEVRVTPEIVLPEDPKRRAMVKQYLEKTHYGAYGLHRASTGRIFHSIIESPKEGRENLRHVSGERFVDIDIKTCHPHLLLPLFNDSKERDLFYADLQNDLYTLINPQCKRDNVKRRVSQYLMTKKRDCQWLLDTDVHEFFVSRYPNFVHETLNKTSNLASHLQGQESDIITRELVQYCMENKLFIITMHDGCLTREKDKHLIMDKLKELLEKRTGYKVSVEEKTTVVPKMAPRKKRVNPEILLPKATNENKTVSPLRIKKDNSHNERKVKHMKRKKEEPQSNQVQIIEFIAGVLRRWKEIGVSDNELKRREEYVIKRIQEQPPLDIYEASALMRRAQLL